jgi:membrane dipeptidase
MLVLDTHVDIRWPDPPDPHQSTDRQVDLPKLRAGAVSATVLIAYVPQGARDAAGRAAAAARADAMLGAIRGFARNGTPLATRADEIRAAHQAGRTAIVPAVENGYAVGTDLDRLDAMRRAGAIYLTLTHNGHNDLADSAIPLPSLGDAMELHGGLSALGRQAVARMNALGLLADVSHSARSTMVQAAEASRSPVVATHSCCRALCDHPRNLDDDQLRIIRDVGGVVQVTAVPAFLKRDAKADDVSVATFCDHVDHVVRVAGLPHAGIGSDFDGGGGFPGWKDASETPNVFAELRRRGYDEAALALIGGGNFLRCMEAAERIARA